MSTAHRILSSTAIQIFGKILTAVLSVVIIKYITSLETIPGLEGIPADYKLIYTYLSFFGILADFGLFTIAVREMSQARDEEEERFIMGNIYSMRLLTIIIAMAMASLFVYLIPLENYSWPVKVGVGIAAITTVLTMMASTASAILQVKLKMELPTIALIIGKIIMAGYIITVVLFYETIPYAFYQLLFAGIAGTLVTYVITIIYTKRLFPFSFQNSFPYWKKIFQDALPYGLAIVLGTIYFKIDVLLLSFFREKQEIAIYGYPSSIIELLAVFPIYFMNSVLPVMSKAFQENIEKVKTIARLSFNFLIIITLPMMVGGIILARPLMELIMSEAFLTGNVAGYYGSDLAFQLLITSTTFAFINTLFSFILIASGKQAKLLKINFVGVLFNIVANLIFLPTYGFIAAGIITILTELLIIFLTYRECRKQVKIPFDVVGMMKITFAAGVMGLFVFLSQGKIPIVPLIGIGGIIFIIGLLPLRIQTSLMHEKA